MTFNEYWETAGINISPPVLQNAMREIALKAWNSAHENCITTFAEWYESKVGVTLEQAKRAGVYDLDLLEEAFNFLPNDPKQELAPSSPTEFS